MTQCQYQRTSKGIFAGTSKLELEFDLLGEGGIAEINDWSFALGLLGALGLSERLLFVESTETLGSPIFAWRDSGDIGASSSTYR